MIFKEPKTGRGRVIALPPFAVKELQSHKARQAEQRLLMGIAGRITIWSARWKTAHP